MEPLLQVGSRGPAVSEAQNLLYAWDYTAQRPAGVFDAAMAADVADFQKKNGLTVDGKIGQHTWRLLRLILNKAEGPEFRPDAMKPGVPLFAVAGVAAVLAFMWWAD